MNTFKRIFIIGSDTMPGHVIYLYFKNNTDYELDHCYIDSDLFGSGKSLRLFSPEEINEIVIGNKDTVFINTLSVLIEESKSRFEKAIYVNSFFPNYISSLLKNKSNKFIHISTDCVFSGSRGYYLENEMPDATDNYGRSKLMGEVQTGNDLTIRTSKIGPCFKYLNEELLDWFLKQDGIIKGYKNALWNGVSTLELAKSLRTAIKLNLRGIYNLAPFERISKFELLTILKKVFNKNITIEPDYDVVVDKSLRDTRKEILSSHQDYYEMFAELEQFMQNHHSLYMQYKWNDAPNT